MTIKTLRQNNSIDITANLFLFTLYITILSFVAAYLGNKTQAYIIKYDLDKKYGFLKVSNEWEVLFSGRVLDWKDRIGQNLELIQVDAVIGSSEGDILYCGILQKFTLDKVLGLDKLYLYPTYRRFLKNDFVAPEEKKAANSKNKNIAQKGVDSRYYNMPGDYLILSYKDVKSINVTYYFSKEK